MKRLLVFLLWVFALCSVVGLVSSHWFFQLFNHYRVQALVASVLLLAFALRVSKKHAWFALALVVLNGGIIGNYLYQTSGIGSLGGQHVSANVKIISANVLTRNDRYSAVLAMVEREKSDIVVLTETNSAWLKNLEPLKRDYPHRLMHPREDNFGLAVYSRLPFRADVHTIGDGKLPLAELDFEAFKLLAAHPVPPVAEKNAVANALYLQEIAKISHASHQPVIVAGDLNATLWSPSLRPLYASGLKRINPAGVAYTWPAQSFWLALQIDHFFAKGIKAADFKVLDGIGSDHFPIQAEIALGR